MVLRVAIFFAILINLQFCSPFVDESFSGVSEPLTADDHKILQECHDEDYRTYLRCLKRHKRHHEINGSSKSCLEDCTTNNCTSSKCVQDCYTRCKKKITEIYSKVTETEYECSGGKCDDRFLVPNITTNVNINIGSNGTNGPSGPKVPDEPNRPDGPIEPSDDNNSSSKITINNMITNLQTGSLNSNCICPGCNCWSLFPQITIGFGPGPTGVGCCYPQPCTCYQQLQQNDCSSCGNPFFRSKCGITCQNFKGPLNNATTISPA